MEENTVKKLSASDIINDFKQLENGIEFLRNFMITGAADISRSYDMIQKWSKAPGNNESKAIFLKDLKTLQNIEHKRVRVTDIIFNTIPDENDNIASVKDEGKIKMMLPKISEILERVKNNLYKDNFSEESRQEAFQFLKDTLGAGKALLETGGQLNDPWDNRSITDHLDSLKVRKEQGDEKSEVKKATPIGFPTIFKSVEDLIKQKKDVTIDFVKRDIHRMIFGKVVGSDAGDTLIKDDKIFEDFWNRMLFGYVDQLINKEK